MQAELLPLLDAARPRPARATGIDQLEYRESSQILTPATGFLSAYRFVLNPYSGCGFGCDYCYARSFAPTRELAESWGRWLTVKTNAVAMITRAVHSKSEKLALRRGDAIYMSSVTDPYQPIERAAEVTRSILEALLPVQPRLTVQTRSPLVTRDIELLRRFERVRVNFTVTTDDDEVRKRYEAKCASIEHRLRAAETVSKAGVPIGISISPMLPLRDAAAFGRRIAALGAAEYVTQYFKPARMRFGAGSSDLALAMARDDGWRVEQYGVARQAIQAALGDQPLLEGDEGYAPA